MSYSRDILKSFKVEVERLLARNDDLLHAVQGKIRQASLETVLAEHLIISLAVQWERFIHKLILNYLSLSARKYFKVLEGDIKKKVKGDFGKRTSQAISFRKPNQIDSTNIHEFIDPRGWNVTFTSGKRLKEFANKYLAARYAMRFSFKEEDEEFLDFFINLRNYLVHRSNKSRNILKNIIKRIKTTGLNAPLSKNLGQVGPYLKGLTSGKDNRAIFVAKRLLEISKSL